MDIRFYFAKTSSGNHSASPGAAMSRRIIAKMIRTKGVAPTMTSMIAPFLRTPCTT